PRLAHREHVCVRRVTPSKAAPNSRKRRPVRLELLDEQGANAVRSVAIGIFCKTPASGLSKTRLAPPLRPEEGAVLSACFIRDLAATIDRLSSDGAIAPYAVYTPIGTEDGLRALLPHSFRLLAQCNGDFGARLLQATADLLDAGHAGAILVNADSPTLPAAIL